MAKTITPQDVNSPFDVPAAGAADFTFEAGDVAENTFTCNGRDLVIVTNTDGATPYTITFTSVDDEKGRTDEDAAYSLAAGDFAVFGYGLTNSKGWKSSTGIITFVVENAAVEVAILRIPAGVGR